jgi:peptidoglycan hydrolase-like protein with peptidoglycan-binding domain
MAIWRMQYALQKAGYLPKDTPDTNYVTGYFTKATDAAVRKFQKDKGLKTDGAYGPLTQAQLLPLDTRLDTYVQNRHEPGPIAAKAIETALTYEGHREVDGPNRSVFIDACNRRLGVPLGSPWCMSFVQEVFLRAANVLGVPDPLQPNTAGVLDLWHRVPQSWKLPNTEGGRGDIMIMDFGGGKGHTGIVLGYEAGYYLTIEGNTNDEGSRDGDLVARKRRKYSAIKGFVRVPEVAA